jgi:hypothetical protein
MAFLETLKIAWKEKDFSWIQFLESTDVFDNKACVCHPILVRSKVDIFMLERY